MEFKGIIKDPVGLHARPASILVQESTKFDSDIKIFANGKEANLKSIMSVMALGAKNGEEITIKAEGSDAEAAIESLEKISKDNNII